MAEAEMSPLKDGCIGVTNHVIKNKLQPPLKATPVHEVYINIHLTIHIKNRLLDENISDTTV